jgi:hypothetical protein
MGRYFRRRRGRFAIQKGVILKIGALIVRSSWGRSRGKDTDGWINGTVRVTNWIGETFGPTFETGRFLMDS